MTTEAKGQEWTLHRVNYGVGVGGWHECRGGSCGLADVESHITVVPAAALAAAEAENSKLRAVVEAARECRDMCAFMARLVVTDEEFLAALEAETRFHGCGKRITDALAALDAAKEEKK